VASQFVMSLDKFRETVPDKFGQIMRKVTIDMTGRIVQRSPVDTGRFRGNWYASVGQPKLITTFNTDKTGQQTIRRANSAIGLFDPEKEQDIWITNSLPYAIRLENGWSGQAPAGMVGVTVTEFNDLLKSAMKGFK